MTTNRITTRSEQMPDWQDHADAHLVDENCRYKGEDWALIDEAANDEIHECAVKLHQIAHEKRLINAYAGFAGNDTGMEDLIEAETRERLQEALHAKMQAAVMGYRVNEVWKTRDTKARAQTDERRQDMLHSAIAVGVQEAKRADGRSIIDIAQQMEARFGAECGDIIKGIRKSDVKISW